MNFGGDNENDEEGDDDDDVPVKTKTKLEYEDRKTKNSRPVNSNSRGGTLAAVKDICSGLKRSVIQSNIISSKIMQ